MAPPKKVGGEIGEVRSAIDIEKLNAYIEAQVPAIKAPVAVKQFKVRYTLGLRWALVLTTRAVWSGMCSRERWLSCDTVMTSEGSMG